MTKSICDCMGARPASQVTRHYDDLLAAHYSWMSGATVSDKAAEQKALLAELGLNCGPKAVAVDLGCGPGYQSMALVNLGYGTVIAIDTSRDLLAELEKAVDDDRVTPVFADLRAFPTLVECGSVSVIVCMGDTLTHLERQDDVSRLYRDAYDALEPDGRLVLTFRDLSRERVGLERFIPVRADDKRLMTCVLEYEPENVVVTDLIHVREGEAWRLYKSSYKKLRLSPASQVAELQRVGFTVDHDRSVGQMHAISAKK
ncbi:class I SAM-dependent methyltransferase [Burkholderia sp. AU30280]|uniref:class I SAM-dependent methyltransferase n=1 Tax=Burkholderia sp. AU30280 TaxID=2879628 RepID=UPI001CF3A106|nr:class I SAM-dependent methyltransferase [Burkholderia sp. AU30280]MCA8277602.1 class I SAM-dependent methyltransferase [Burkholderia sp. AU30280]